MNKITRFFGAVVAMCSLSAVPAQVAVTGGQSSGTKTRDEAIMSRLLQTIEPTFSIDYPDLGDQSHKST